MKGNEKFTFAAPSRGRSVVQREECILLIYAMKQNRISQSASKQARPWLFNVLNLLCAVANDEEVLLWEEEEEKLFLKALQRGKREGIYTSSGCFLRDFHLPSRHKNLQHTVKVFK